LSARSPVTDVEISIVTLGDAAQLGRCMAGLQAACGSLAWRLTIVDNSARELALGDALASVPAASVVRSKGRRGFAANQNLALSPIIEQRRARYVLILNDDTELDMGCVSALVRHADSDMRIGAVSPVIRDGHGNREADMFAWPTLRNQAARMLLPSLGAPALDGSGWLNGAAMLVRMAALVEVGMFDESFFLFFEETDLCRRMVRAGWRLGVCGEASLTHHRYGTTRQHTPNLGIEQQVLRSRYLYFRKHHGAASALALDAISRAALAARAAKAAAAGRDRREHRQSAALLWQLARYPPSRPSTTERQASIGSAS
jgi:GT2 family glycosyltransferase